MSMLWSIARTHFELATLPFSMESDSTLYSRQGKDVQVFNDGRENEVAYGMVAKTGYIWHLSIKAPSAVSVPGF
jgi:hypothetical protein